LSFDYSVTVALGITLAQAQRLSQNETRFFDGFTTHLDWLGLGRAFWVGLFKFKIDL